MFVSIPNPESYFVFKERLESYTDSAQGELFPFFTAEQAVFDLASAMALTFSHKMSVAVVEDSNAFFSRASVHFSRLGYNVQTFRRSSNLSLADWIENLKKDTLFVLAEQDDIFTGEVFDLEEAKGLLSEKKIFQLILSNHHHFCRGPIEVGEFETRILQTGTGAAVAVLGARTKIQPVHVLSLDWRDASVSEFQAAFSKSAEEKEKILKFESMRPAGAEPYFEESDARLFDRAVLYWSDVTGDALRGELLEKLGSAAEPNLEAPSSCRWDSDFSGLRRSNQGILVISQRAIEADFVSLLQQSHAEVKRLQG